MEIQLLEINCTYNTLRIQKVTFFLDLAQINDLNIITDKISDIPAMKSHQEDNQSTVFKTSKFSMGKGWENVKETKEMKMNPTVQR